MTATSAFVLHRNADNSDWMAGMWGPDAGPGTVWKLDAANGYKPEVFARIKLDGRANTGAGLGNIAFDRWNRQFYVSDHESGMIHRLRASDGADLGHYDHGTDGRAAFSRRRRGSISVAAACLLRSCIVRAPYRLSQRRFRARAVVLELRRFPPPRLGRGCAPLSRDRRSSTLLCALE